LSLLIAALYVLIMTTLRRVFFRVDFPISVLKQAMKAIDDAALKSFQEWNSQFVGRDNSERFTRSDMTPDVFTAPWWRVDTPSGTWTFDSEAEFLSELRMKQFSEYHFQIGTYDRAGNLLLSVTANSIQTVVEVGAKSREELLEIMAVFDDAEESSLIPIPEHSFELERTQRTVFIGHGGHGNEWRELESYLQQLGLAVQTFENGPRAGHDVADVVASMVAEASLGFLICTAEDEHPDGSMHPRMNVVHELGLVQGALGWERGIVLLEEGCETFSNINGIVYIPFPRGSIRSAFGEVSTTIKAHFGSV
jgi:hypothetical protein